MADIQINKPSTHSSSDSKDPDKPNKKRKNPSQPHDHQTGDDHSPPSKRPQSDKQPAKETEEEEDDDIEDTATSNPKKKEVPGDDGDPEAVTLPDVDILQAIIRFHGRNGVYPFENSSTMRDFFAPWIRLGIGKPKQLVAKIEQVKNKYNGGDEDVGKYGNEEEFQMWMKINWGKKSSGSGDKGGCS